MCVFFCDSPTVSTGLSYSQGMNDILARFLLVLHNEVDCYWAFVQYMEHKKNDFAEDTMIKKVGECCYNIM